MKRYLECKVKNILSCCIDQAGHPVTQEVIVTIRPNIELLLFDYNLNITKDLMGKMIKLKVIILDSNFPTKHTKKILRKDKKVVSVIYEDYPHYEIYGKVVDKEKIEDPRLKNYEYCIIDIAEGFLYLKTEKNKFKIGDYMHAYASRLDIGDILTDK